MALKLTLLLANCENSLNGSLLKFHDH